MKIYPPSKQPTPKDLGRNLEVRVVTLHAEGTVCLSGRKWDHPWVAGQPFEPHYEQGMTILGWIPGLGSENINSWMLETQQMLTDQKFKHEITLQQEESQEHQSLKRKIRIDDVPTQ